MPEHHNFVPKTHVHFFENPTTKTIADIVFWKFGKGGSFRVVDPQFAILCRKTIPLHFGLWVQSDFTEPLYGLNGFLFEKTEISKNGYTLYIPKQHIAICVSENSKETEDELLRLAMGALKLCFDNN